MLPPPISQLHIILFQKQVSILLFIGLSSLTLNQIMTFLNPEFKIMRWKVWSIYFNHYFVIFIIPPEAMTSPISTSCLQALNTCSLMTPTVTWLSWKISMFTIWNDQYTILTPKLWDTDEVKNYSQLIDLPIDLATVLILLVASSLPSISPLLAHRTIELSNPRQPYSRQLSTLLKIYFGATTEIISTNSWRLILGTIVVSLLMLLHPVLN